MPAARLFFYISCGLLVSSGCWGQGYPRVPAPIQAEANQRLAASDRLSDDMFKQALPAIQAWAAKGKPYLPGAAAPGDLPQAKIPAFPGAWGGGMYAFGGRGGRVIVVTNLNDRGPGSFRAACEAAGPRIVVFNVAGVIRLTDRIRVRAPYITIAGNTAPGDGVCIAGNTVELETHDIIVRHMRFRRGAMDASDRNDSFGGNPVGNLIIDHVSASWGLDENMSMYRHMYQPPEGGKELKLPTVNVTIQYSIFSESLNIYHHAFGSTIGGLNSTFHHNLWACNTGRNPSVGMYGDFTFVNNVLFNYRHRTVDGGDHRSFFNIINNTFKPGPGTPNTEVAYRILKPESERSKTVINNFGKAYVSGNVVEGNARVTQNNWDGGVQPSPVKTTVAAVLPAIRVDQPFAHAPLEVVSAAAGWGGGGGLGWGGRAVEVSDGLRTWVVTHPKDAQAWHLLSEAWSGQGELTRSIRADAESRFAQLDYPAALDRLKAAQEMLRSGSRAAQGRNADIEASIIDTRTRQVAALIREQTREDQPKR